MKRTFRYVFTLLSVIALAAVSCKKEEIPSYSGKAYIQWESMNYMVDSLYVNFSFQQEIGTDTYIVELPYKIIGKKVDRDRKVALKQVLFEEYTDKSTGIMHSPAVADRDFTMPGELVVPRNELSGSFPVTLKLNEEMSSKVMELIIEFVPDDIFEEGMVEKRKATVVFSNILNRPSSWNSIVENYTGWGKYSIGKHRFINKVLKRNIPDNFFESEKTLLRIYLDKVKKELDLFNHDPENIKKGIAPLLTNPDDPKSPQVIF